MTHPENTNDDEMLPAVESDSFLLIPHTVIDLEDFTENHESYLVSVSREPERAAALWRARLKRNPYGDEGFVSLSHYGRDLISGDLWDQVGGIWSALVEAIEAFLDDGQAEVFFPGQPVPIALRRQRQTTLLTIHTTTSVIDPETFFPGVLEEAERYHRWVQDYIGEDVDSLIEDVARVRAKLPRSMTPG